MKKIKKPRTVSDGEASAMLHDAGLRRVQTATYASHSLAMKMQAVKVLRAFLCASPRVTILVVTKNYTRGKSKCNSFCRNCAVVCCMLELATSRCTYS